MKSSKPFSLKRRAVAALLTVALVTGTFIPIASGSSAYASDQETVLLSGETPVAITADGVEYRFEATNIASIESLTAKVKTVDDCTLTLNGQAILTLSEGEADLTAYRQYLIVGENTIVADVAEFDESANPDAVRVSLSAGYASVSPQSVEILETKDPEKTPAQLNVHVGDDSGTQVNISFTTIVEQPTTAIIISTKTGAPITVDGVSSVGAANKYFHKIPVSGLEPDTEYIYSVGVAPNTVNGKFKTAPNRDTDETVKFIYLADTQVANAQNGEALGATLAEVKNMNPDFVYLAGDVTDTSTNESQWEQLFENTGAFPHGGSDMFSNYLIAAVQGNHDNNTFNRHINAPAEMGNIVYSFDYGPITFVMLNLEAAGSDANARAQQKVFLENTIAAAKAEGRWTAVGFHKSLYTGASHIVDSDIIAARAFWGPVFAELDVDFVLQGHDHVYSRGFVDATGYKATTTTADDGATIDPSNSPLYMVGGHAGGLKWYSMKNYTVSSGDPLAPGYSFLDVDSADPTQNASGKGSDVLKEQVIVEIAANKDRVEINTYMFKYDEATDTIVTPKYLYDSMSIVKNTAVPATVASASLSGPEIAVVEAQQELTYSVSLKDLLNARGFDTQISYDADVLEFVGANGLSNSTFSDVDATVPGKVRVIQGVDAANAITATDNTAVAQFVFRLKAGVTSGDTTVTLITADTTSQASTDAESIDVKANVENASIVTKLYSEEAAADVNGDGKVSLVDLVLAIDHYRETGANNKYDINRDGTVDAADFIIISNYIKK